MLGYILLQANESFVMEDGMYTDNKKFKYTKGNLYLGRYSNNGRFLVYDDTKDGCPFIHFRGCMGPWHPYYTDYFIPIEYGQVPSKKEFAVLLDVFTKCEYGIDNIIKGIQNFDEHINKVNLKNRDGKDIGSILYGYIYHDLEDKQLCFESEDGYNFKINEETLLFYNKDDNSIYISI